MGSELLVVAPSPFEAFLLPCLPFQASLAFLQVPEPEAKKRLPETSFALPALQLRKDRLVVYSCQVELGVVEGRNRISQAAMEHWWEAKPGKEQPVLEPKAEPGLRNRQTDLTLKELEAKSEVEPGIAAEELPEETLLQILQRRCSSGSECSERTNRLNC